MNVAAFDPTVLIIVIASALVLLGGGVAILRRRPKPPVEAQTVAPTISEALAPDTSTTPQDLATEEVTRTEEPSLAGEVPADAVEEARAEPEPESEVEPEPEIVEPTPTIERSLKKSRGLFSNLRAARRLKAIDEGTWEDLEATMLRADVGVATTAAVLSALKEQVRSGEISDDRELFDGLKAQLVSVLERTSRPADGALARSSSADAVTVWLVVGVNGVGKTTTIGKLANRASKQGMKVLLAAGDTFRAAAGEQLATWGDRSDTDVVKGAAGGDPSAIIFDALQRAKAKNYDVVLADTAGRLHNKVNLVEELKKIRRVADKDPGDVTEVLLVIDATTGQNALVQARQFTEAVSVTGVVLTKLDGTAKGGVVLAIEAELGIPVRFIGVGEGLNDLLVFEPTSFIDALVGDEQLG
jgi:fused signal recognition particle receptor